MGAKFSTSNTQNDTSCCNIQKHGPSRKGSQKPVDHVQAPVSMRITRHVTLTEGKDTNMVLCPLLIQLVLSLIAVGSGGPTRTQMLQFLRSESVEDLNRVASDLTTCTFSDGCSVGGPKLSFVNSVCVDRSLCLKQTFRHVLDHVYKAGYKQVDFQTNVAGSTREVNLWVESNTNGLIKELIPPGSIDANTRLIFANALYFKGKWMSKFDQSRTIDANFNLLHGGSVKVPFMTSNSDQYIATFSGFKVLRLCYEKGRDNRQFSMYIFLPNAKDGLSSLLQNVSSKPDFVEQHIPRVHVAVNKFMIPRFKISFGVEASETLKQMNLTLPFSPNPDLSKMLELEEVKDMYVSRVFHKGFIEVNEEGTEAAGATASVLMLKSIKLTETRLDFVADHPFLFIVREDVSGALLFIGHVMNPLNSS